MKLSYISSCLLLSGTPSRASLELFYSGGGWPPQNLRGEKWQAKKTKQNKTNKKNNDLVNKRKKVPSKDK